MSRPRLIVTGAAGFLGRRLIESLAASWDVEALDRREPTFGTPVAADTVRWHRVDVANSAELLPLLARLRAAGPIAACLHLAAHYDFTGERHPEYQRTNVGGTRLLLEACRELALERFVFASSVAACDFPRRGAVLDEASPPDGRHVYAESKRAGEEIMRREAGVPTAIVRFAALYSDWCEYFPLYRFLDTWLSCRWDRRMLGGRGESAVPFLHVRDACRALGRVLDLRAELKPAEVVLISPNEVVSHEQLFRAAAAWNAAVARAPFHVPMPLAACGIVARDLLGRALGRRPFERPWMIGMIDRQLRVDATRSQARLDWAPRESLRILRRMPFLLENRRSRHWLWTVHNEARLPGAEPPLEYRVLALLERHEDEIFTHLTSTLVSGRIHLAHDVVVELFRGLSEAVQYQDRVGFRSRCRELARKRALSGAPQGELVEVLQDLERTGLAVVLREGRSVGPAAAVRAVLAGAIEFALDGVAAGYEEVGQDAEASAGRRAW